MENKETKKKVTNKKAKSYEDRETRVIESKDTKYLIIKDENIRAKYSISSKDNDIFMHAYLYDQDNPLVWREVIEVKERFTEVLNEMIANGGNPRSVVSKAKKQANEEIRAKFIEEIGEEQYRLQLELPNTKKDKASKQKKEVKDKIKVIREVEGQLLNELPEEVTKVDTDIVSQINNMIKNDETINSLKEDKMTEKEVEEALQDKANLEVPNIEIDIALPKSVEIKKESKKEVKKEDKKKAKKEIKKEEPKVEVLESTSQEDSNFTTKAEELNMDFMQDLDGLDAFFESMDNNDIF